MQIRRRARIVALQALFEIDTAHHEPDLTLRHRLEETDLPEPGVVYATTLLKVALQHLSALDAIIQRIAPEWPIDQMAPVDRNVLRLAACEILYLNDTPAKVAINEAVEIAKQFGSDSSSRFVNGVLGTLYAQRYSLVATPAKQAADGGEPGTPTGGEQQA